MQWAPAALLPRHRDGKAGSTLLIDEQHQGFGRVSGPCVFPINFTPGLRGTVELGVAFAARSFSPRRRPVGAR